MTMLDDDRLASLLARAGEAFEVPAAGPGDILARAASRGQGRRRGRRRRNRATARGDGHATDDEDVTAPLPEPADGGRVRRIAGVAGRHRVLSAAACVVVVLVLAGAIGALVGSPSHPTLTSGLPTARVGVPAVADDHRPAQLLQPAGRRRPAAPRRSPVRPRSTPGWPRPHPSPRPTRPPRPRCRAAPSASPPRSSRQGPSG